MAILGIRWVCFRGVFRTGGFKQGLTLISFVFALGACQTLHIVSVSVCVSRNILSPSGCEVFCTCVSTLF